ncbi:hypothetical protein ASPBRDRAFT_136908 [Aspergillus brasiliensis CBS 101740]|uniref:Uncharacterized protein n=1 Tax=Aspergillus brasiliensis (strain CBS 101740 / IMI 381727 / IBT 21946) TaxID=767769 RepID=A0A1L9U5B7_ASPBC|nr:hypothetical protein ASPBRDRAFT_136908 [Aspergillus brasiliensis CBS 101740]
MAMATDIVAMLCSGPLVLGRFKPSKVTRRILPVVPVPRQVSNPHSLRVQKGKRARKEHRSMEYVAPTSEDRHALASRQNAHYDTCG